MKAWLNTIHNTDCLIGMKKLPDKSIDLILADPPYGISRKLNTEGKRLGSTAKLSFNFGDWDVFNSKWFDLAVAKTKGWIITFCAKKDIGFYWNILEEEKFVAIDALVWQKPDPLPLNAKKRFVNAWESIVVGKRPGSYWGSAYEHNILKYQAPKKTNIRVHPTQKPLGLIEKLIVLTTKKGDIILDPFLGSGTTALAAKDLERYYIGFEISEEYCNLAKKRVEEYKPNGRLDFN